MNPAVQVQNLTRRFGNTVAVDDVTLSIDEGSITGMLGRNGAGKTVLMSLITDQDRPTSGYVRVLGKDPFKNSEVLCNTSFIRDNQRYPREFKVKDLLKVGPMFHRRWNMKLAHLMIEAFELPLNRRIGKMSRGQISAAGVLVGLSSRAPVTLLDEPYLGMDATHRKVFYDLLLREYTENPRTIILSTHLIDEVDQLLDRVVVIEKGRIVEDSSVDELRSKAYRITGLWSLLEPFESRALQASRMGNVGELLLKDSGGLLSEVRAAGLEISRASIQDLVAAYGSSNQGKGGLA